MTRKQKKQKSPPLLTEESKEELAPPLKGQKLYNNLLKMTRQFVTGKGFYPATEHELMQRLNIPPQHVDTFQNVLHALIKEGVLQCRKKIYTSVASQSNESIAQGTISMHVRGFGFFQADDRTLFPQDVFIPKHLTQNAVDGDRVEVNINLASSSPKGPEGKIISILERSKTHLAGTIFEVTDQGVLAYLPSLGPKRHAVVAASKKQKVKVGDRYVFAVVDWGDEGEELHCKISHSLGHISDATCDIDAAIEEFELRKDFPSAAVEEAKQLGNRVKTNEIAQREDFRDWEIFTIDPDTAKDFDDALSLVHDARGHYHLGVHIADVSHYVRTGTALDEEAAQRCNSTYFPGRCIPMLPPELSDNLCSLRADVNRLTISVIMEFDATGDLLNHRIVRSVIRSAKRFTYREAKKVLDGELRSKHAPTLQLMVEFCHLLKAKRRERGSIEFALPDFAIRVDPKGTPLGHEVIAYDITHQLVEEFMLKANEMVALSLDSKGRNLAYRIHDEPSEENMKEFVLLARGFGFELGDNPTQADLQRVFDEAKDSPYGQYLATCYIRRNRLAIYSADNIGHYGLGLSHYCHFTSPIRRYIDLIVHRLLFGQDDDKDVLNAIADRCSEQERISAKAENNVVLLKKLRLLQAISQENPDRTYLAVVTRIRNYGVEFEVIDFMLEGFLHVSELDNDYYVYNEHYNSLRGLDSGQEFHATDHIVVSLRAVDLIFLTSKWNFVDHHSSHRQLPSKQEKGKKAEAKRQSKKRKHKNRKVKK